MYSQVYMHEQTVVCVRSYLLRSPIPKGTLTSLHKWNDITGIVKGSGDGNQRDMMCVTLKVCEHDLECGIPKYTCVIVFPYIILCNHHYMWTGHWLIQCSSIMLFHATQLSYEMTALSVPTTSLYRHDTHGFIE